LLIKNILLPVDFPVTSVSIAHEAAILAERFEAKIVMLHVVTPESQEAGVPTNAPQLAEWNLLAEILRRNEQQFDRPLRESLEKLVVRGVVVQDDPSRAILRSAKAEDADLIMMASYGAVFDEFLLGAVTAKVLRGRECPVWTSEHREVAPAKEFSIQNILCAVDLGPRSQQAASWAAQLAADFGAHLTLSNVTESMAIVAPGGTWTNPRYQQILVDSASQRLTELQKKLGIQADLLIGSGDVPQVLSQIAKQTKADLLVLDCYPYSGNLRAHGYAIICAVPVPVLSV
jgi:universal stress protein A